MSRSILITALALGLAAPAAAEEVVVFAAASMKTALDQVASDFQEQTGHQVVISYAGSNALAKQIIEGAPADIFVSAAVNWMDEVEKAGLVAEDSRKDMFSNTLVLVAHGDAAPVEIGPDFDLKGLLAGGKLSMALVDAVPAGQYGKASLESLGVWAAVEPSVAQADNVRAALALVATGEAPYGIVYATDAVAEPGVKVVGTFPAESHKPIIYPGALLTGAQDAADKAFYEAITSDAGDAIFASQGFVILN
ncbi:molybdate ABC transporter substrate-binding protein [Xinfangfangia sp. CPCC 101601]|uniref:Molybdate ABC transporter substrate-binding protein n=1 Tax=Pseudogemmobacter lacusdianii TaxID=3069608 RepID=A0ABU0VZ61_9RHOB|nr:molybdate ABC transporter substrate-binding protein [Xinfangfangia sp. CPCC 101601]MDQ2067046.1 molybdate ABC transporter substrate-binding protein [Xinfangfangia sp. CPCC 101601]